MWNCVSAFRPLQLWLFLDIAASSKRLDQENTRVKFSAPNVDVIALRKHIVCFLPRTQTSAYPQRHGDKISHMPPSMG